MINWKIVRERIKELVLTNPRWRFPTVRSLFYHLGDVEKIIPLTEYGYKKVDEIAVDLRKKGEIPFEYFEVRRGRSSYLGERALDPEYLIEDAFDEIMNLPDKYSLPFWYAQPCHVEVWIEKIGLLPTFEEILRDYDVKVRAGEGYASWEWVYASVKDIKRYLKERSGDKVVVLYFGDLDPSGVDIGRHVRDAVKFFGINLEFKRVALFPEQVKKYNLPLWPEKMETIDKIMRDPRRKKYFEKYGRIACELDSFVSKAFDALRDLTIKEVEAYISHKHIEERKKLEKAIKDKLRMAIDKDAVKKLKEEVLEKFRE